MTWGVPESGVKISDTMRQASFGHLFGCVRIGCGQVHDQLAFSRVAQYAFITQNAIADL
jgi:hypothetical protein